jgi:hypothetical protein
MSYTVPTSSVIDYPAETLATFPIYAFEWIDNLHFIQPPDRFLPNPSAYVETARALFLEAGWGGEGEVGLMWLPAFMFPLASRPPWVGITLWHIKQVEDGISWLISPIELPFEGFARWLR